MIYNSVKTGFLLLKGKVCFNKRQIFWTSIAEISKRSNQIEINGAIEICLKQLNLL